MPFKDYAEFADPLRLPINGKVYEIPPVGLADGIRLAEAITPGSKTAMPDEEFTRIVLGKAYSMMLADNVPGPAVLRASLTALAEFERGRDAAEAMWETGGNPKALDTWVKAQTNRETRRKAGRAGTTPRPASTSSTTKPRPNSKAAQ